MVCQVNGDDVYKKRKNTVSLSVQLFNIFYVSSYSVFRDKAVSLLQRKKNMKENDYQILLKKSVFDDLKEKASYTEDQIAERALKMWEKEGRVRLDITLKLRSSRVDIDDYDEYSFGNYAFLYNSGKFCMPSNLKEKLRTIIEYQTKSLMEKSFGEHLTHINNIVNLEAKHEKLIKRYKVFTLTGWLVGILAVIAAAIL